MKKIILMGAGNIGQAFLNSWKSCSFEIIVVEPHIENLESLYPFAKFVKNIQDISKDFYEDFLVLAFKPQNLKEIMKDICNRPSILVSVLAGIPISFLKQINESVIRVMPNLAIKTGKSINLTYCDEEHRQLFLDVFSFSGLPFFLKNEEDFDYLTTIFGCGPAYFFLLAKNLCDQAENFGLSKENVKLLVDQLFIGSASLIEKNKTYTEMMNAVASKGGATEAALNYMHDPMEHIIEEAVSEAYARIKAMKKENCT